jgi:tetratricopeptide (TPR) repeat protein
MRKFICIAALAFITVAQAQVRTPQASPKSTVKQTVGLTEVEIEYSRPGIKGRTIFGDLVPFGRMWRTGANANTTVSFSEDVTIDNKTLKKGKYAIFTTPKAELWDVVFYTDTNNWGLPEPWQEDKVALRTSVKPEMLNRHVESFTVGISNLENNSANLEIVWEKTLIPIKFEVPTHKMAMASIDKVLAGPSAADYFAAAQYYFQSNGDMNKALTYVNKALELNADKPFWYSRQKSLIQAKLGDKKGAIETAKISMAAAQTANNADYVKMNQDSINEWSKK